MVTPVKISNLLSDSFEKWVEIPVKQLNIWHVHTGFNFNFFNY
jgi:hypothetical protein